MSQETRIHEICIDTKQKIVRADGNIVKFPPKLYEVLEYLAVNKGIIITKNDLLSALYGDRDDPPELKIIDIFISKIGVKFSMASVAENRPVQCIERVYSDEMGSVLGFRFYASVLVKVI